MQFEFSSQFFSTFGLNSHQYLSHSAASFFSVFELHSGSRHNFLFLFHRHPSSLQALLFPAPCHLAHTLGRHVSHALLHLQESCLLHNFLLVPALEQQFVSASAHRPKPLHHWHWYGFSSSRTHVCSSRLCWHVATRHLLFFHQQTSSETTLHCLLLLLVAQQLLSSPVHLFVL